MTERLQHNPTGDPPGLNGLDHARLLESVLDAIPDVIGLLTSDRGVLRYNHAGHELTGTTPDTIRGKHCYEMIGRSSPCEECAVEETLRTGKAARLIKELPDQGLVIDSRAYPVRDDDGKLICIIEHLRDVTAERKVEKDLIASRRLLTDILNSIPQGVFWKDDKLRYLGCNDVFAATVGLSSPEEIVGMTDLSLPWPHQEAEAYRNDDREVLLTGRAKRHLIEPLQRADGARLWVDISKVPLRNPDGDMVGVLGVYSDITELRRAQEERHQLEIEIQQAQKLESLGLLAGGIAHDFNNLLVAIMGQADLLLEDLPADAPARQGAAEIREAAQRASELTNQMLAYSGKGRFVVRRLDINSMVRDMVRLLASSIPKKVNVDYHLADAVPPVQADVAQMRQIVMNLVTNAADAIGEQNGTITLSSGVAHLDAGALEGDYAGENLAGGKYVTLEVRDTGCGMGKATLARLFDPFFTTKFVGRGLGLAAVLGIVRGHHGAITVTSEPGRGACFRVYLPCAPSGAMEAPCDHPAAPEQAAPDTTPDAGNGCVLVVDDEATVRSLAERVLRRNGFDVVTAGDGRQALALLKKDGSEFSAVLLDQTMPQMDGRETLRAMRDAGIKVPVLLSSGYCLANTNEPPDLGGAQGFIQKPYTVHELLGKMHDVIRTAHDAPHT